MDLSGRRGVDLPRVAREDRLEVGARRTQETIRDVVGLGLLDGVDLGLQVRKNADRDGVGVPVLSGGLRPDAEVRVASQVQGLPGLPNTSAQVST